MKVIVIGGGPAGILSAISAKKEGNQVTLIEKMNSLGKKLLITGKGRCNITNAIDISEFMKNIPCNGKFLFSAFKNFNNEDILNLLDIPTKVERGNRVFPVSDKSSDVLEALMKKLNGVEVITNCKAEEIIVEKISSSEELIKKNNVDKECKINQEKNINNEIYSKSEDNIKKVVGVKTNKGLIKADKIILATGGMSYPGTGSTGDGYVIAKKLGHTITEIKPSLVALKASKKDSDTCQKLQGLSLKNVKIDLFEDDKKIYEDFGEMLFTHFGLSGPIILSASAHIRSIKEHKYKIKIDFKPALTNEKLQARILRDFDSQKNKDFKNSLDDLLPKKLIPIIVDISHIRPEKKINEITREERIQLAELLKNFEIEVSDFGNIEEAIITSGGINVKEINPKTMESKIVKGLYFAGEIIDVDGYTGGFNLQIAYSTGYTAGLN